MAAYLAPVLVRLRLEVNGLYPKRDKTSDGWIGDAAHASRASDHNPLKTPPKGLVRAFDLDKDGIDVKAVLKATIADPRLEYIIFNGTIWSRQYGWKARAYKGSNPHTGHIHFSCRHGAQWENDTTPFLVGRVLAAPVRGDGGPTGPFPYPLGHLIGQDGRRRTTMHDGSSVYNGRHEKHVVMPIQREVGATVDGRYGPNTALKVRAWQDYVRRTGSTSVRVTGVVDPETWAAMTRR